ncbi:uncharacterized protein BX664DRAFT_314357 [Halteromyces radiatus]|uniref:uncharacterized protein n=1 Tax=Halteromyces radiatus TaxID=101107 RepID=UPI002220D083|nr:uncharacterized protein BX664DRAFT_314357 [Halteromyces radiatus]KAI8089127.1 hypothetical protein BX664DRAFT_314357 [Halteromyces radiatus]
MRSILLLKNLFESCILFSTLHYWVLADQPFESKAIRAFYQKKHPWTYTNDDDINDDYDDYSYYDDDNDDDYHGSQRWTQILPSKTSTAYTTLTGSCIAVDDGSAYYDQYQDLQRYFRMGVFGSANSPNLLPQCEDSDQWGQTRGHWNGIFFGDYEVGSDQQTLGPLAIQGNFIGRNFVIDSHHAYQCDDDKPVDLDTAALVVGGAVTGGMVIARGDSYIGDLSNSDSVRTVNECATHEGVPLDFEDHRRYWTSLSKTLAKKMPTHLIDYDDHLKPVTGQPDHWLNVFTFNTCNGFQCPLWPGFLSCPDKIFSGYDTWEGPKEDYPSEGTIVFNIPVDDGTTFAFDSIKPSADLDYCRTIYNVYPSDAEGNYLPNGHITIRRNTLDMIKGLFLAPQADIQDGDTGRFAGMIIGDNYSWQNSAHGPELADWAAGADGQCSCSYFTGCLPTCEEEEEEEENFSMVVATRRRIYSPVCPIHTCSSTPAITNCKTTLSKCTATKCMATTTASPVTVTSSVTVSTTVTDTVTSTTTSRVTNCPLPALIRSLPPIQVPLNFPISLNFPRGNRPADSMPTGNLPEDSMPTGNLPTGNMPIDNMPLDTVPGDTMPVDSVPEDTMPLDTVPEDTMPLDTVPGDTMPLDTMPLDTMPLDTMPLDTMPLDTMPTDSMPTDSMPEGMPEEEEEEEEEMPHKMEGQICGSPLGWTEEVEWHAWHKNSEKSHKHKHHHGEEENEEKKKHWKKGKWKHHKEEEEEDDDDDDEDNEEKEKKHKYYYYKKHKNDWHHRDNDIDDDDNAEEDSKYIWKPKKELHRTFYYTKDQHHHWLVTKDPMRKYR